MPGSCARPWPARPPTARIFPRSRAIRANFAHASIRNAAFNGAELERANFSGANLEGSSFEKAELGRANFVGARLSGNVFAFANLARADFRQATMAGGLDFSKAYVFLARIEGADLSFAKGLEQSQIDLSCGDAKTKLPAGLRPPETWPCASD